MRDKLNPLLHPSYEVWDNTPPMVISTYYSKSVKLPVYQIKLEKYGLEIILRNNFYDWKVTVNSEIPLDYDFMGVFNPAEEVEPICCEGFPKDKIFGCYKKNHSKFTFETESRYDLYTFFFLLKNYLGIKKEN